MKKKDRDKMNKDIERHQARMLQNKSSTYMYRYRSNSSPGVSNSNLTEGNIPKNTKELSLRATVN
jgi:hypothetical protein